jgi:hypothetical protein
MGVHAPINKLGCFMNVWFKFDQSVFELDKTACPYCFALIPAYTGYDGINCMCCGRFICTEPVQSSV